MKKKINTGSVWGTAISKNYCETDWQCNREKGQTIATLLAICQRRDDGDETTVVLTASVPSEREKCPAVAVCVCRACACARARAMFSWCEVICETDSAPDR